MLLHLVADYGAGDLAFAEVRQRLALHVPEADVVAVPVPPFDTLAAGFCIGQLALGDGPADRIVYANVAPRADEDDPRPGNEGEQLVAARLANGALVVAPDAGHTFSFVAAEAVELHTVQVPASGSQFRSRDAFPQPVAALATGDRSILGGPLSPADVPSVPDRVVAYTDGYGNIKTTWTTPPAPAGTRVTVRAGDRTGKATVSDGTFAVPQGETSFAPGSSGWRRSDGQEVAFFELFARGGSAAALFGHPASGARVTVEPG